MDAFNAVIDELKVFIASKSPRVWDSSPSQTWPAGGKRNIVIGDDVGLELGNPQNASIAALVWTTDSTRVMDNRITLIGPDVGESERNSLPFGKAVLVQTEGMDEDNAFYRHMEMEAARYDVDLNGYMIRAVSGTRKEWCRISRKAIADGFNLDVLGHALMKKIRLKPYVRKVELVFITSGPEDVMRLSAIVDPVYRIVAAMNKMLNEMALDCGACDYSDVCREVEMLGAMREKVHAEKPVDL